MPAGGCALHSSSRWLLGQVGSAPAALSLMLPAPASCAETGKMADQMNLGKRLQLGHPCCAALLPAQQQSPAAGPAGLSPGLQPPDPCTVAAARCHKCSGQDLGNAANASSAHQQQAVAD